MPDFSSQGRQRQSATGTDGKPAEPSKSAYKKLAKNAYSDSNAMSLNGTDDETEQSNIDQHPEQSKPLQKADLGTKKEPMSSTDTGSKRNTPDRIRTCDLRIRNSLQTSVNPCKQRTPENDWPSTGQDHTNASHEDPDLKKLMEDWSQLSDDMKKAIIKMTS